MKRDEAMRIIGKRLEEAMPRETVALEEALVRAAFPVAGKHDPYNALGGLVSAVRPETRAIGHLHKGRYTVTFYPPPAH